MAMTAFFCIYSPSMTICHPIWHCIFSAFEEPLNNLPLFSSFRQMPRLFLKIGGSYFLSNPFQFIISSSNLTPWGWGFFILPLCPEQLWGRPNFLSNGNHRLFPWGVKWLGHEADHSPPSSAKVKEWGDVYLHSSNTPSWCGDQFKKSTGTTLLYNLQATKTKK
jgi:hypothetical protein